MIMMFMELSDDEKKHAVAHHAGVLFYKGVAKLDEEFLSAVEYSLAQSIREMHATLGHEPTDEEFMEYADSKDPVMKEQFLKLAETGAMMAYYTKGPVHIIPLDKIM